MEKFVCGRAKSISPFVVTELFKRYAPKCKDYIHLRVEKEPDKNKLKFSIIEAISTRKVEESEMNTGLWWNGDKLDLVMLRIDDTVNILEYDEMQEILERYNEKNKLN